MYIQCVLQHMTPFGILFSWMLEPWAETVNLLESRACCLAIIQFFPLDTLSQAHPQSDSEGLSEPVSNKQAFDRQEEEQGGTVAEWVRALACTVDRTVLAGFESHCGKLRFGTLAIPFTPLCQCLSEETLKAGPFYLVSMPGEVKDPTSPHWNV